MVHSSIDLYRMKGDNSPLPYQLYYSVWYIPQKISTEKREIIHLYHIHCNGINRVYSLTDLYKLHRMKVDLIIYPH